MRIPRLFLPYPWALYSKKLIRRIEKPLYVGRILAAQVTAEFRLVQSTEGNLEEGNYLEMDWLVDLSDGVIADVRYRLVGDTALLAAAEAAAELSIRKTYLQAQKIRAEAIDQHFRDQPGTPAFPVDTGAHINFVLFALETAAMQCHDIPVATPVVYTAPDSSPDAPATTYPGWELLAPDDQIKVLEQLIQLEIRPYVELDGGGVSVKEVKNHYEVIISYQGACTSCYSSIGGTLQAIQQILRQKIHPLIIVTPDLQSLQLS